MKLLFTVLLNLLLSSWAMASEPARESIEIPTNDGLTLGGQIAFPAGKGPFPAVLMLVGSGPVNRYEPVPSSVTADGQPSLLFRGIEESLINRGFAVMMYDKRGVTPKDQSYLESDVDESIWKTATANNLAADAQAAFTFLSTHSRIDSAHILVLGHSEGTALAVQIAERHPEVNALLLMGMFTESLRDIIRYQNIDNTMRMFRVFNAAGDGYLTKSEFEPFTHEANPPSIPWELDRTGDGRVSDQELQYAVEQQQQVFEKSVADDSQEMVGGMPRLWFAQYFAAGPWLNRLLPFCKKTFVFQGEVDVQTPFWNALKLTDACDAQGTPLGQFNHYPDVGHGFSPRIGLRKWRDTIGPIDVRIPSDIASAAIEAVH